MAEQAALKVALDLLHFPWRVRLVRREPLPDGVILLLRLAAGDGQAEREAAAMTNRSVETVRDAAIFFIEQILLYPEANSYRVLGASSVATAGELKRNMALLMASLHPDVGPKGGRSVFAARVSAAWNDLKTSDRRAAYDNAQQFVLKEKSEDAEGRRKSVKAMRSRRRNRTAPGRPEGKDQPPGLFWRMLTLWLGRSQF
jgi:hypothetical protein